MKTGEKGLPLIKPFEGLRLRAYQCSANVWTIGYGHTAGVRPGDVITPEQADAFLRQDVADAERAVGRFVRVPLTQHQFDALVSFTFNLGSGNLRSSTLLRLLNAGDYQGGRRTTAALGQHRRETASRDGTTQEGGEIFISESGSLRLKYL